MSATLRLTLIALLPILLLATAQASACAGPSLDERLQGRLPHLSETVAANRIATIVAFGSSSTEGIGASTQANSYPSRLAIELAQAAPNSKIRVLNKGVGGETEVEMSRRIERDVIAQNPDLVIWQVGANAVIEDLALGPDERLIHRGIDQLKNAGIDVILMDLQYSPEMLRHRDYVQMESYIFAVGRETNVPVFRRFALMRHWLDSGEIDASAMIAPDQLHMTDLSYACLSQVLAGDIAGKLHGLTSLVANRR
jgi:acyl-CoA thioesterase-1